MGTHPGFPAHGEDEDQMDYTTARPFSIRIFLPDGRPDGLRIVEKSNWTGCGLVCPRQLLPTAKARLEFERPGVYVLVGPSPESDLPMLYIGEGDPVRPRLEDHFAKKDFWTWVVFFMAKDGSLNKAHVQYLESRLVALAKETKRSKLDNANVPAAPALSEPDRADVESFLLDILSIFPLVGLSAFQRPVADQAHQRLLHATGKGVQARGYESAQGFVVLQGSGVVCEEVPSIPRNVQEMRAELIEQAVINTQDGSWRFSQDYAFGSPSIAAGVVLGRSANGRIEWKDEHGRTLREIQEATASTPGDEMG